MATLTSGKIAEVLLENAVETHEHQMQMLNLVDRVEPDAGMMQNSGNVEWRTVQQHRPIISGFDVTGSEQGIIEETYPAALGVPDNDIIELRIDDLRDEGYWKRAGEESGKKQASNLNQAIAALIANTGSLFYNTAAVNGFDAIAEGQALMNERQLSKDTRCVTLNDRDQLKYAQDLAGRQTLQGRPESEAWSKGQIGANVAEFDVYTGSFLPTLTGGTITATTTTAAVSEKPEAGSVDPTTLVVNNIDYRTATIAVVSSAVYAAGDYITFDNAGTPVNAVALTDKTDTGELMTFKVVSVPNGTSLEIYPKPIAVDDAGLTTLEKAYANINTQIASGSTVNKANNYTGTKRVNALWCKDSVEVTSGDAPLQLLNTMGGMRVINTTMSNGQKMYLAYDGNVKTLNMTFRLFTWWGITNKNPSANGVFVTS